MKKITGFAPSKRQQSGSFDDRLETLYDELSLAVKWRRPSILVAVYSSEIVREQAQAQLQKKLENLGQQIQQVRVSAKQFDIPLFLSQQQQRENTVFFVTGLKWGGGKRGFNAYRALNLRREFFVDYQIRAILWLTKNEAALLPRRAPDFWAFRHKVVEFFDYPVLEDTEEIQFLWSGLLPDVTGEDVVSLIHQRECLLAELPEGSQAHPMQAEIHFELSYLYWLHRELEKAKSSLDAALAQDSKPTSIHALIGRGIVSFKMGHPAQSIQDFQHALELEPENVIARANLSLVKQAQAQVDEALTMMNDAVELDPENPVLWTMLGDVHFRMGFMEDAKNVYLQVVRLAPDDASACYRLGKAYLGLNHFSRAIRSLRKATRLDASHVASWRELGEIYRHLSRFKEAQKAYQVVFALDPTDAYAQDFLTQQKFSFSRQGDAIGY